MVRFHQVQARLIEVPTSQPEGSKPNTEAVRAIVTAALAAGVRELPEADLAHLTQIDYDREMAFVAVARDALGVEEILGVARACVDPDNDVAEFAVLVRSDLKRQGLGTLLMRKLIRYCRERGTRELRGDVLSDNLAMLHLASALGFTVCGRELNVATVALDLRAQDSQAARPRQLNQP